jgi:methylmalonyl-CoA mutase
LGNNFTWDEKVNKYKNPIYSFKVRDKEIEISNTYESLSHSQIPKVALPKYQAWGDILKWNLQENVPGEFPFCASGLYPFKREGEDPSQECLQEKVDQNEPTNVFIM